MSNYSVCRLLCPSFSTTGASSLGILLHKSFLNSASSQVTRTSWNCPLLRRFSSTSNDQPKTPVVPKTFRIADVFNSAMSLPKDELRDAAAAGRIDLSKWTAIYKFPNIRMAGIVQRLKLYQTAFTCLLAVPTAVGCFIHGIVGEEVVIFTSTVCGVACVMLYVMGSFFSRLIGFIYISKEDPEAVRIAHMTFWGKRKDEYYQRSEIIPFSELPDDVRDIYIQVKFYDQPKSTLYLSLKYGNVIDKDKFEEVFGGIPELIVTERKGSKRS